MGVDSHVYLEVKNNGKWEFYREIDTGRWYDLFGKMAGVRSYEEPIVYPKGLPEDISSHVLSEHASDYFSASWFNKGEISKLKKWIRKQEVVDNEILDIKIDKNKHEDYRIIFWFDC